MTNVFPARAGETEAAAPQLPHAPPLVAQVPVRPCEAGSEASSSALMSGGSSPREDPDGFSFRNSRLLPRARLLLCEGRPVLLGSRAFDLLEVLLRNRGAVVSKEQIVRSVWPNTTVEESNLRFQMAALRKALGPDRELIKTIPGRGYVFAAEADVAPPWERALGSQPAAAEPRGQRADPLNEPDAPPEHVSVRPIEACERRRLETLANALLCCLEELRQISGKSHRGRVGSYGRTRPDLRGQHRFQRQRAQR